MAEALVAISLAGNIIQFISFSFVLVSKTKELYESASDALDKKVDLKIISQDIRALSSGITSRAGAGAPARLSEIASRCNIIAKELLDAIAKLDEENVPAFGESPRKSPQIWRSFRKALRYVWKKEYVEELKARLESLRDQVTMHLVSDTCDNQVQLVDLLDDFKVQNRRLGYRITSQIQALDSQLQGIQKDVSTLRGNGVWGTLNDAFSGFSSEVHLVSRCHVLIASLRYDFMQVRQSAIRDAHTRTFAWMYSPGMRDTLVLQSGTGFTQWLQRSSGIYWVTGKPDGLDEYYGDSWEVIETLRDLSEAPNVKLCLSSRPWNCFKDSFGRGNPHVLRLYEYTRPDIELFARENLLSNRPYMDYEPTLFDDLVQEIGERAQGVFLWVRLVVRSLRNGIDNEDSIPILQERLRTIPSDLEEFFEQILGSVEGVYRGRMAGTFLAAIRSPHQLKLIHYYFLEQTDTTLELNVPSKIWQNSIIQRCAEQTERRLNGRFKGLLEVASPAEISAQTRVDFLHRTLSDFLATERMRQKLQSWASNELNVFTAISRALIAESKFVAVSSPPSLYKLAVELASKGAKETGNTALCFEVIEHAERENERMMCSHSDSDETYDSYPPSTHTSLAISCHSMDWLRPTLSAPIGKTPLPSLVIALFGLGADPNAIVDGTSHWAVLVDEMIKRLGDEQEEQCWAVLEIFLAKGADVNTAAERWTVLIDRIETGSEHSLRNAARYFRCLFSYGLDPNAMNRNTTLTKHFLRMLIRTSFYLEQKPRDMQHELLRKFLRVGADVSMVYMDRTRHGWFQAVCPDLKRQCPLSLFSLRVMQYRIFLEHGLDPNIDTQTGVTIWRGLLYSIGAAIKQRLYGVLHIRPVRDMVLISLQYGADPHVITIQGILAWMKSCESELSSSSVEDIQQALRKEIEHRERQTMLQPHLESRSDRLSRTGTRTGAKRSPKIEPPLLRQRMRQGEKRDHEDMSHGGKIVRSKRRRFG
ncbi:hypothetical protein J4E93_007189 [Alternaria ventricosa]|uniref:uncharacterized protein n=1 Tax=Alternaria ventricosa TaxID=1187951 RepID=UPI0020C3E224|nr:uncharacterized protein J4E93_007189 [Alternaria ventricosa]KAI4643120.1 hypothetical protein J4E93_007189 [Alternaria ventricosa]